MKKLLAFVLALCCIVSSAPAVFAGDAAAYELPELNMVIKVPGGWLTFTQNTDDDDADLKLLGTDSKTLTDFYKQNNIYLDSMSKDFTAEIIVTMKDYDGSRNVYDFNLLSADEMESMAENLMKELPKQTEGRTYSNNSVYSHKQAKFAVLDLTSQNNGAIVCGKQYYTIINGQAINVILSSYTGEVTDELAQTLKNTVDSIEFTKVTEKPGIDWKRVLYTALIGGAAGGIIGVILHLRKKKRNHAVHAAESKADSTENYILK